MKFDMESVFQALTYAQNILKLPEEEEKEVHKLIEKKDSLAKLLKSYSHEEEEQQDDVKEFLNHIRNKHHEADDVIDTHKSMIIISQSWTNKGIKFTQCFIFGPNYLGKLRCLNEKIEKILTNQSMIERVTTSQTRLKKVSSWEESNFMVGFKQEKEKIVKLLTQGSLKLDTISIVGMGGIGKSTFAREIFYNNSKVINHFECLVWVDATRNFKESEFLLGIVDYLCRREEFAELDIIKNDEKKLKEMISKYLRTKRYLIVIDDVWFGRDVWIKIRKVFPDNNNQSRLLLTSRSSGIGRPFYLLFLNEEESWLLLSRKALVGSETQEQVKFGKLIASKCGGLPASIMVMAGILADEDRKLWWKVDDRIKDYLYDQEKRPLEIIFSSSYDDLPHYLKQCLLYLIAFPEDTNISVRKLIRLWTSEGLITEIKDGRSIEKSADDYIYELYRRSLIQVRKWRTDKGIKQIRIHSVLRELCIINSTKEKFLHVHRYPHSPFPVDNLRRLAIYDLSTITYIQNSTPSFNSYSVLHSILCFDKRSSDHRALNPFPILSSLSYKYFKYLRVLDIGFVVTEVPKELGCLHLLRYIRINAPFAKLLPESITKLSNLQTLDARNSRIFKLPEGIWEMKNLRHLYLGGCDNIPRPKYVIDRFSLGNLQSLSIIHYHGKSYRNFFDSTPNLIKLGLHGKRFSELPGLSTLLSANHIMSIPDLRHLQTLKVVSFSVFPKFQKFPNDSLKKITIFETKLSSYDMLNLGKLPNLQILKLRKVKFETRNMICEAGTFHELQVLHLLEMEILQWKLVKDAMANLSTVVIDKPYPNLVESFRCINSQSDIKLVMKHRKSQEGNSFGENQRNNQTRVSSSRLYKLCKVIREE